jgi:hypothetical protein
MTPTVKLFVEGWPKCRRIVCTSGDEAIVNYVRRAGEWEALRPDDASFIH